MKSAFFALLSALFLAFHLPVLAQDGKHDESVHAHHHRSGWVKGEVVKIDLPRKYITLKHEAMDKIGMDAMTMPFEAKNAALLKTVKVCNDPLKTCTGVIVKGKTDEHRYGRRD